MRGRDEGYTLMQSGNNGASCIGRKNGVCIYVVILNYSDMIIPLCHMLGMERINSMFSVFSLSGNILTIYMYCADTSKSPLTTIKKKTLTNKAKPTLCISLNIFSLDLLNWFAFIHPMQDYFFRP